MPTIVRKLMALLTALVIAVTLVPGVGTAEAALPALSEAEAVQLLQEYLIVRGNPGGQLDLDQPITRAQAATVFVRVLGYESLAQALKDAVPFTDAQGHWAAGEIAMAERLGLMRGDGNGTFRPQSNITYAEVLTVLLRVVKQEPEGPWSAAGIFAAADRLGIAPRGVTASATALRGKIFWSLSTAITRVQLPTGLTVLQTYHDQTPPTLSLSQTAVTTPDSSTVISGTTKDAVQVLVDGSVANLDRNTGRFTQSVSLKTGPNSFVVEAFDMAGNKATVTFTAERKAPITTLEVEGPAQIRFGTSVKLTVKAKNAAGNYVSLEGLEAALSGDVATFDVATTTLKAGNRSGRGVLTLRAGSARQAFVFDVGAPSSRATRLEFTAINNGVSPTIGKETTVKVHVLDANNNLVNDDFFRTVRLTAVGGDGVVISPSTVETQAGVATFTVKGTRASLTSLVATSTGLPDAVADVEFLTANRVVIVADNGTLRPDGASGTRIMAYLRDERGNSISNNSGQDIHITLQAGGTDGYLVDQYLVIPRNRSSSDYDNAQFKSGLVAGSVQITGVITSGPEWSVQSLTLPIKGTPDPVRIQVVQPTSNRITPGSAPTDVSVVVLDSRNRVVTWGSFAFRLRVTTNSPVPMSNGLPEGMTLTFPSQDYGPVYDAQNERAYSVAGRTHQGAATVKLAYSKSGVVTITPQLLPQQAEAYHPTLGLGAASASTGLQTTSADFVFAGTPTGVQLKVSSALGTDKPAGAVATASNMTIKVQVVDANGIPVPGYNSNVTLTRGATGDKVTRITGTSADTLTRAAVNGVAEFTIQATNTAGFDVYTGAAGNLPSASTTVAVRKAKPATPEVVAMRGVSEGDTSPVVGWVGPEDAYMDIQLATQPSPHDDEPTYWVNATVTRKGDSTALVANVPVNLMSGLPVVRVPKEKLRQGQATYQVIINDGHSNSDPSPDLGYSTVVNAVYSSSFRITAAYYDAATTKLVLATSGLASTGTVAPERLTIVKDASTKLRLGDSQVTVESISSSSVVLKLNGFAAAFDPDRFNGALSLVADSGWYTSSDQYQVAQKANPVPLRPGAVITHGTLDKATRTLYLYGAGFSQATVALEQIKIGTVAMVPGTTTNRDRLSNVTDTRLTIALSQSTYDAIDALPASGVAITAATGWLKLNYGGAVYNASPLEGTGRSLHIAVTVNSAAYNRSNNTLTLSGKGFAGASLDPTKILIRRTNSTTAHRLSAASVATTNDDTSITIVLGSADAAVFEGSTSSGGFSGRQVFLNTESGWLEDAQGRMAAPVPTDLVLFTIPAQ